MRFIRVALLIALSGTITVEAARVQRLTLSEVRDRAATIVVGDVVAVTTRLGDEGRMVWTDYQLRIVDGLRGERGTGELMTVSFVGGKAGGLDVGIGGIPKLQQGKRYLFFVSGEEALAMPTIGWGQGLYSVETVGRGAAARQLLLSIDGEPLEINQAGELTRGRRSYLDNGALVAFSEKKPSKRLAPPRVFNADGSRRAPVRRADPVRRRTRFATIEDIRAFVGRDLSEARTPVKR